MFRTLAEFSELMSMAIIQKSPLGMSLAHISTLRIQAQKGCVTEYLYGCSHRSCTQEACRCSHGLLGAEIPLGSPAGVTRFRLENGGPQGGPGWDVAKGSHFSASFIEEDCFRASNGHLPSHSFQKGGVGGAKGGISPASSPHWRRRERGRE